MNFNTSVAQPSNPAPSIQASQRFILLDTPNFADARKNRIHVLGALKRFDDAVAILEQRMAATANEAEPKLRKIVLGVLAQEAGGSYRR